MWVVVDFEICFECLTILETQIEREKTNNEQGWFRKSKRFKVGKHNSQINNRFTAAGFNNFENIINEVMMMIRDLFSFWKIEQFLLFLANTFVFTFYVLSNHRWIVCYTCKKLCETVLNLIWTISSTIFFFFWTFRVNHVDLAGLCAVSC